MSANRNSSIQVQNGPDYKLGHEGCLSLYCGASTILLVLLPSALQIYYDIIPKAYGSILWGPILYYALINLIIRFALRDYDYQIAIRASFLGFVIAVSILIICFAPTIWKQFGVYGFFIAFFHYTEFLAIAYCNPRSLSIDSFMLNHSWAYGIAATSSWLEFILEVAFLPKFKNIYYVWLMGVALCVFGEIVRKCAIFTANGNFTHLVQYEKFDEHKLITHGIYNYCRHPSYVGWFWWSIGTQIILLNPICIIVYIIVSWKFFNNRIYCEEYTLLNFFRHDYKVYQEKVPTGLPFIQGFFLK